MMAPKRSLRPGEAERSVKKRKILSIQDKLRLVDDRDSGASVASIAVKYGVGEQTVRDIYKRKADLMRYASSLDDIVGLMKRKNIKRMAGGDGEGGGGDEGSRAGWLQEGEVYCETIKCESTVESAQDSARQSLSASEEPTAASGDWWWKFTTRHGLNSHLAVGDEWNRPSPDVHNDDSKEGLPGNEERGNVEFSQSGEDMPVALSPEQFLSEASEREPTPAPPTPTPPKPESYQLRHNNHLTIVLEALARDEAFMDVTLTAQGRSLKAHKSVLSAVSPYFRGVLRDNPCQHPIIIMPRDVRFEELFSIVNYIYKGEMTVAAEDLTSLLKTAEILQVSGLAPSDSSATVNPNTDPCSTGNVRSSSASSSSSSSTHPPGPRTGRVPKPMNQGTSTPPARPKSRESMINPTDFMDVDMTCVKEEVASGGEEDDEGTNDEAAVRPHSEENEKEEQTQDTSNSSPNRDQVQEDPLALDTIDDHTATTDSQGIKSEPSGSIEHSSSFASEEVVPYICPHCQEMHRGNDMIASHLRLKHPSKPSFVCMCGRVFVRQLQHQAHTRVCSSSS